MWCYWLGRCRIYWWALELVDKATEVVGDVSCDVALPAVAATATILGKVAVGSGVVGNTTNAVYTCRDTN